MNFTEARFLKHVDKTETCWFWTAATCYGYGLFKVDGRLWKAHRVAYELWNGEIPAGLCIRHKCDVRSCVNPEHLETGTPQDNMDDMVKRGRHKCKRGETHGSAKLTDAQVIDIRSRVGQLQQQIADEFEVSKSHICNIRNMRYRK